jgi:hypothetical protein
MEFDDRIIAGHEKESDTWQYSLRPRIAVRVHRPKEN